MLGKSGCLFLPARDGARSQIRKAKKEEDGKREALQDKETDFTWRLAVRRSKVMREAEDKEGQIAR